MLFYKRLESAYSLGLRSYIDTPEFLDGVECNDLLQQIVPVVALPKLANEAHSIERVLPFHSVAW